MMKNRIWVIATLAALVMPAQALAQTVRYVHTDALGSVVAKTDANRNVIERREYEPYGRQLVPTLQDGLGYTGHVQDAATGLTYMQQRYYDPGVGLFLSVDPVTAFDNGDMRYFNRYAYAANNPYKFTDPDGRFFTPETVWDGANVVMGAVSAYNNFSDGNIGAGWVDVGGVVVDAAATIIPVVPGGAGTALKVAREGGEALTQRAATREAKRQAGIPTSQQPVSQTNGRASDGTSVGRQQTYETPAAGGGTERKSVQVSRDQVGSHAGMPQIEAGTVKPGGQVDSAGRPRIQNEEKVRVDFEP